MNFFEPQFNFMRLEKDYCAKKKSYFKFLPAGYDGTTSYLPGTRKGPQSIIEASKNIEWYDMELDVEPWKAGIYTSPPVEIDATGVEKTLNNIYRASKQIIGPDCFTVGVGGEHSVSFSFLKASKDIFGEFSVVHFDAHADLRNSWEGASFSHACLIRRVYDDLNLKNIVQAGIRSMDIEEKKFLKNSSISCITAGDIYENLPLSADRLINNLENENVYITFDVDVFDSGFVWDTGTPEPGGLNWQQIMFLLKRIFEKKNVIGADVVELIGNEPSNSSAVAKLIYKIMGLKFWQKNYRL
ncbi:MAG: agmatinase [Candidatus Muiribacteriota bacterium]